MPTTKQNILHLVHYANINKWSAFTSAVGNVKTQYPMAPLSKVLTRIKEPIVVEDNEIYKRITVRLYGQGVLQRDELLGKDIGTKRQFVAHKGQLIISRIDARNGAFGIVPEELEGAIVTNDFWLFDVIGAVPQYLMLVLSSERFQQHWQSQSSGTTNRQRVNEDDFLTTNIALPSISEQMKLLDSYNVGLNKASKLQTTSKLINDKISDTIMSILNIRPVVPKTDESLLKKVLYKDLSGRWEWDSLSVAINEALSCCKYPIIPLGIATDFITRSWKKVRHNTDIFRYIEIGGINPEENIATANDISVANAPSRATQVVKTGDLIIGTTRPYLKRFALIRDSENDNICSSGFQVIQSNVRYDLKYILEVLKLDPIIKQFETLMTGALYPAVNTDQLRQIRIPLPPIEIQNEISAWVDIEKNKKINYYVNAECLRQRAKEEFEKAVFGVLLLAEF